MALLHDDVAGILTIILFVTDKVWGSVEFFRVQLESVLLLITLSGCGLVHSSCSSL